MLADTLSRLIEIDDDIKLPAEQEGHEFGYVPFEKSHQHRLQSWKK